VRTPPLDNHYYEYGLWSSTLARVFLFVSYQAPILFFFAVLPFKDSVSAKRFLIIRALRAKYELK
jgi:hypothetical protein